MSRKLSIEVIFPNKNTLIKNLEKKKNDDPIKKYREFYFFKFIGVFVFYFFFEKFLGVFLGGIKGYIAII
jgi:hypothetical protein